MKNQKEFILTDIPFVNIFTYDGVKYFHAALFPTLTIPFIWF